MSDITDADRAAEQRIGDLIMLHGLDFDMAAVIAKHMAEERRRTKRTIELHRESCLRLKVADALADAVHLRNCTHGLPYELKAALEKYREAING